MVKLYTAIKLIKSLKKLLPTLKIIIYLFECIFLLTYRCNYNIPMIAYYVSRLLIRLRCTRRRLKSTYARTVGPS